MRTNLITSIITFFILSGVFAQANLNPYKYVIVPESFDFLREPNQYRLNELTHFLFEKYGFTAVMEGSDYPEDLLKDRCLALRSNLEKDSGMFRTKLKVILKDCNDRVVFTSKLGESREKEFQKAYTIAARDAFSSFESLNYKYTPKSTTEVAAETTAQPKEEITTEIEKLKEEIKALKEQKEVPAEVQQPSKVVEKQPAVEVKQTTPTVATLPVKEASDVLYAQEITNGFQLVDSSPKVVYRIKNTGLNGVFLVEGKSAIVYKKGDSWVLEHYENGTLKQQELKIKF